MRVCGRDSLSLVPSMTSAPWKLSRTKALGAVPRSPQVSSPQDIGPNQNPQHGGGKALGANSNASNFPLDGKLEKK